MCRRTLLRTVAISFLLIFVLTTSLFAGGKKEDETSFLISIADLDELAKTDDILVLDIRDQASYNAGHIPGALLVPLQQVEAAADQLRDRATKLVTYCSCPAEESSMSAALKLRARGITNVYVLVGGYDEWIRQRRPVISGSAPL
ncbi:MAG: hypothetical protein CMN78_04425 [Spirochaetales bacterium]|nr:hypothetical protein [Spirochaetales bacterium]